MSRLRWPRLSATALFNTVAIIYIVATQLHIVISAPASTAGPPPDDVSAHVIDDVTAARRPAGVPSDGGGVRSNEATRDIIRLRRHLLAAQGCGPVCNRCRQVRLLCSARRLVRPVAVSNKCIAVGKVATPLQELTCHMGSLSVTCHPAEVIFPPLPEPKLVLDLATPEGCQAELT